MVGVIVKEGESIESALKRFKRDCANAGIMSEIKRREFYEKPSIKKRRHLSLQNASSKRKSASFRGRIAVNPRSRDFGQ